MCIESPSDSVQMFLRVNTQIGRCPKAAFPQSCGAVREEGDVSGKRVGSLLSSDSRQPEVTCLLGVGYLAQWSLV